MRFFTATWQKILLVGALVMGLQLVQPALAAKNSSSSNSSSVAQSGSIGFSVSAKIPDNQIHKKNSYFDLKMTKGKSQVLKTVIYNTTNRDIKVQTAIHTAYTNTNGVIDYVTPAKTYDSSLLYKMSDITKLQGAKTVTVPANGSKVVSAQVTMPNKNFNGVILGGWYFRRADDKVTGTVKGSMNIKNQYSYVIGLKYTEGTVPSPKLTLEKVTAGMENYHRGIFPYLRNTSATIISNLTMNTTVTSKNSGKVVKKEKKQNVQIAPNSFFKYPLLTGSTKLQAGKYHLHMVVKNSEHRWVFDKDFTISEATANEYNKKSVDNAGINIIWFIVFGALGMLILVLLILWLFFFLKKRRQNKDKD
ncbi:DUF916 and DUF3324 domain-containing protein [Lactiplantibacillus fabifermentans]|uniref:Cell surface protein n=2 Tax=Lactiplantibacillus fabifermentans TaxID=483011 RepID=A0A0R2NMB1_9LACO|nr:DUF916 and DUF3324 domain-containing protein [Lactiplantibacillus fabifermentans]ETY73262.1 cell surface protein [Lactiplantibacillus fabifermentans T30PCM01]KRO26870.1 cell surface protein [Lactiplantibacillus fabifermentans DSM 21115]